MVGKEPHMQGPHIHGYLDHLITRAIYSGAAGELVSACAASTAAVQSGHGSWASINAVSHCLWPTAIWHEERSFRYSACGATLHMGSAAFWGVMFEALCENRPRPPADRRHRRRDERTDRLCHRLSCRAEARHTRTRGSPVEALADDALRRTRRGLCLPGGAAAT